MGRVVITHTITWHIFSIGQKFGIIFPAVPVLKRLTILLSTFIIKNLRYRSELKFFRVTDDRDNYKNLENFISFIFNS